MFWAFISAIFASAVGMKMILDGWRYQRPIRLLRLGIPSWVMVVGGILCLIPLATVTYAYYLRCTLSLSCW